jgi:hypothetical protein
MTDDRKAAIALTAGSLGGILTMAIHPTAAGSLTAEQVARLSTASAAAHSLAMVSVLVLFLGACGLARHTAARHRLSFAAIVTFGFACVAIVIAAAVSGFIVPNIMKHMVRDLPANAHQWQIVIDGIFQFNQAFARIYSVATSLAIVLWSISALRNKTLAQGTVIYGCIVSPLIILGIAIGHLRLDVHGMAIVTLAQAIWFIAAAAQLFSTPTSAPSPHQSSSQATPIER